MTYSRFFSVLYYAESCYAVIMFRILGVASSIAISLIISWAALHFDTALLVIGLLILAFSTIATIIWIGIGGSFGASTRAAAPRRDEPPPELDARARALFYLERARDNGHSAYASRFPMQIDQSLHEITSALGGIAQAYSFGPFEIEAEGMSRRRILRCVLEYIDSFYFLIRQGHIAEAKRAASSFEIG